MLKKTGVVMAAVAGFLMVGGQAFAAAPAGSAIDPLARDLPISSGILSGNNIDLPIGLCGNHIGVVDTSNPLTTLQHCIDSGIVDFG